MKKFLSLLLSVLMIVSCIPAFADATYTISAAGALKVNKDVKLSGEVVIPETVDGVTVTSLDGFAFNNQNDVTSIVMPDTIQSMSGSAINFLNNLTSVKLSENLTVIDDMNFCAMKGLTSLTIPASVCFIGDSLTSLQNLQTLTFEGVCPMFGIENALNGLNRNCVIYVPDDQVDAYKAAFTNGYGTEEQVQPSGKNAVIYDNPADESEFVFDAATGAITGYTGTSARLQIPATIGGAPVKAIAEKAFSHNSALCFVIIPEGVETIGNYAFDYCDNLVVVDFPSTLKKIGDSAFEGCYLSSVGWKEGLEEIGANAFARYGVQTLTLPTTVKTIGEAAFKNGSIRKLYIGKNIESIGPEAFANNFLDRVELLTDRMIQIDDTAFAGNTNDTYVYLRWNVPYDVYKEYEHLFLNIYEGYTYLYIQAPIKDPSLGLEYPANGTDSYNQDVWVSYNGTQPNLMTWYSWNRIPITTLGDGLFKGNQTIKSWYCSHEFTMHHIGKEAFADSTVEFVDLYHEIYTIGEHAFRNCVNIKEITLPETLTSIAANAFEGCTGLEKITILCDPSILPAGLLDSCTALKEVTAGEDATDEQKAALEKALFGKEIIITQQPADVTVGEGGTANIEVQLESTEGLSFTWYVRNAKDKDFTVDAAQTGSIYSVVADASCDGRMVYCVISDDYGTTAETDAAMISIAAPIEITKQPEGATLPEGAQANVTIEVAGEGPVYAWYVNDALYADCTGNVFNAPMTAELDGAQVYCVVTDAYGKSASSEKAVLKMAAQLAITAQPATAELTEGEMTNITVEATGDGLAYQWYVMPVSKSEFAPAEGFNTNVYSVPVDFDSDWSQVYCVITDAYGNSVTSETASIFIAEPEIVIPEVTVDEAYVGHWTSTKADADGMILDRAQLEQYGMVMDLELNEDGSAVFSMMGEEEPCTWGVTNGFLYFIRSEEVMEMTIPGDGTISYEGVIFEMDGAAPAVPAEPAAPAAPAGAVDASLVGHWVTTKADLGGMVVEGADLETYGLNMWVDLAADGTASMLMEGEEYSGITWGVADGMLVLSLGGDAMIMQVPGDGTLNMDGIIFEMDAAPAAPAAPVEEEPEAPAAVSGDAADFIVGSWKAISGEADGMTLDKSMLEMFGLIITLEFNEDGTGVLAMEGEDEGPINWSYADSAVTISVEGDSMTMTVDAEGTITGDFGGVYLTFEKAGDSEEVPEVEMYEDEQMMALLAMLAEMEASEEEPEATAEPTPEPVPEETVIGRGFTLGKNINVRSEANTGSDIVVVVKNKGTEIEVLAEENVGGTIWYRVRYGEDIGYIRSDLIKVEMQTMPADVPAVETEAVNALDYIGLWNGTIMENPNMNIDLKNWDMVRRLTLFPDGVCSFYDGKTTETKSWVAGSDGLSAGEMKIYFGADGSLVMEKGSERTYFVKDEAASADYIAEYLEAHPEAIETVSGANDAAAANAGFAGTWYACYVSTGGFSGDMRPLGVNYTLVLREDGNGSVDFPEYTEGIWYEENGFTYFGQGGDNADMPMTLMDGGFMQYGSDLGGYLILSQDPTAVYDPSMGTAMVAPGLEFATYAPAAPAAPAEIITDLNARLERKFVVGSYTSVGITMDASTLGTEYSVIFHENGTCDFTMAGMTMPNLPWGMQKVAVGLDQVDAFVINYYGMAFNAILTDTGFDMDYYGTMNLHFVPAE